MGKKASSKKGAVPIPPAPRLPLEAFKVRGCYLWDMVLREALLTEADPKMAASIDAGMQLGALGLSEEQQKMIRDRVSLGVC